MSRPFFTHSLARHFDSTRIGFRYFNLLDPAGCEHFPRSLDTARKLKWNNITIRTPVFVQPIFPLNRILPCTSFFSPKNEKTNAPILMRVFCPRLNPRKRIVPCRSLFSAKIEKNKCIHSDARFWSVGKPTKTHRTMQLFFYRKNRKKKSPILTHVFGPSEIQKTHRTVQIFFCPQEIEPTFSPPRFVQICIPWRNFIAPAPRTTFLRS